MPELHCTPTDKQLDFAKKPLILIDPQRASAFKARYRGIEKLFDEAIKKKFEATKKLDPRARHSTAESRALEVEKNREARAAPRRVQGHARPAHVRGAQAGVDEFAATSL